MPVNVHEKTLPGAVSPHCKNCKQPLPWDIPKGEYVQDKNFWDAWVCAPCNGGKPLTKAEFRLTSSPYKRPGYRDFLFYTGVGSRKTPQPVLDEIKNLSRSLAERGYTLRSGGSEGADTAFELGAAQVAEGPKVQIYLPWKGFNGNPSSLYTVDRRALSLARRMHPVWDNLSIGVQKLHARNCYQVLGLRLDLPSKFLVCWTPDSAQNTRECSSRTGGTATAIKVADYYKVPIFNLAREGRMQALQAFLDEQEKAIALEDIQEPAEFIA